MFNAGFKQFLVLQEINILHIFFGISFAPPEMVLSSQLIDISIIDVVGF